MLLQFVTMQPIDMEKAQDTHQDWEMDLRVLARNYLLSWFVIDFCSIAPSAVDLVLATGDEQQSGQQRSVRLIRMMRAFRLVKLFRLLKASRVIARFLERARRLHHAHSVPARGGPLALQDACR